MELALLTQLHSLDLSHNLLTKLPTAVAGLPHLMVLNLSFNRIDESGLGGQLVIGRMGALLTIGLTGNPLPKEILAAARRGVRGSAGALIETMKTRAQLQHI